MVGIAPRGDDPGHDRRAAQIVLDDVLGQHPSLPY